MTDFKVISEARCEIGESPVWDDRTGCLLWTDIPLGLIFEWHATTGTRRQWTFGEAVGSFGLCASGRLVVALVNDVVLFDRDSGARSTIATVTHGRAGMRLNDSKVGPDGAFWVGSMDASGAPDPQGTLYRVAPDGDVRVIATGFKTSNGLAFGPGGTLMYHSDSRGPWVDVYDLDPATGEARNRRRFRDLDEATGRPDGGACDVDGCYWSAGISAGRLNRFAPDGTLRDWIDLPVSRPTMPCFGGPDGMTLYVSSLSSGSAAEDFERSPLSGQVIALPAPVRGVAVERFRDA
ncbi:MAG: SMP-30/gluconolactonase/LRE family protein [Devosia sp.]|jgi:sugar lactone lactonase YvrE|uniref:SMP-30/gluconolactonase/LRE family protein n=1 Tax=Devosia sp. TaxID=1871048 RepID=UPI0037C065E3